MSVRSQVLGLTILSLALLLLYAFIPAGSFRKRKLFIPPQDNTTLNGDSSVRLQVAAEFSGRPDRPRVTNVAFVPAAADLMSDVGPQFVVCDAVQHTVAVISYADGQYRRRNLVPENSLAAPCHTALTDYDGDGDMDLAVAILGRVWPSDARCGQVVVLEQQADRTFQIRTIARHLRRVSDVQPGDFDGDGDVDFVVAEFGYKHGGIQYLERLDDGSYVKHDLFNMAGTIHVPVADFDGDGDLDFAALVSQDAESVLMFENTANNASRAPEPNGNRATEIFRRRTVWSTINFDQGTAGMIVDDLDQDGDPDLIVSAGDNLELEFPYPQPWHGCFWLENDGFLNFTRREAGKLAGTYAAAAGDLDADGDRDLVIVSMFNQWSDKRVTSVGWLENDGSQNFSGWHLASAPTHLCTVATGDIDQDGVPEIIAGGLHLYPPFDPDPAGITIWRAQPHRSRATP